jgi:hypothetical protein
MATTRRIQTLDGLPVYDATEPLWIEVTAQDVKQHRRRDPERCALAAACKRELHVTEARAYLSRLYIRYADHWKRYQLPETVRTEVATFDRGGGFSSGTYRIPPLSPTKQSSGRNSKRDGNGNGKPKPMPKRPTHRDVHGVRAASPLMGGALETLTNLRKK